jgi:ATP-binding cassette subfamily F protein 3
MPSAPRTADQRKLDAQKRQQLTERLRPLKKSLEQAEKRLEALNREKAALEATLSQPAAPAALADAGRQLKAVNDAIDAVEAQWLELTGSIEAASQVVV